MITLHAKNKGPAGEAATRFRHALMVLMVLIQTPYEYFTFNRCLPSASGVLLFAYSVSQPTSTAPEMSMAALKGDTAFQARSLVSAPTRCLRFLHFQTVTDLLRLPPL